MPQDDLKRRIAEMRAAGKPDDEIARTLQEERNRSRQSSVAPEPQGEVSRPVSRETPPNSRRPTTIGEGYRGAGRALLSGLTLGAGDEIEGFVRGVLPGGQSIRQRTETARQQQRQFREDAPGLNLMGELVGGALPVTRAAGVAAKGAKALGLGSQIRRAAGTGAGIGGAAGFLSTDGSVGERLPGAVFGAGAGVTLGAAAPVVGAGIARVNPKGILSDVMSSVQRVAGNERGAVRMSRNPDEVERLGRQFFQGQWGRPEQRAVQLAVTRAEREGLDFNQLLQQGPRERGGTFGAGSMTEGGRPVMFADVGGPSAQRLLGAAETDAPQVRGVLTDRSVNRPIRMADDVIEGTGAERVNLATRADDIMAEERPVIDRLYAESREQGTRVPLSVPTSRVLQTPETQKALGRAEAANVEAVANRGRRPLEPLTETVEEVAEVPMAAPGQIVRTPRKDGRVVFEGGNPKYAGMSTERIEALYKENLDRIQRSTDLREEGARFYTRETNDGKWSGFIPKNEYGRGVQMGNVAERQARELEAEIVGRYQGMPIEELGSRPNIFAEQEPIWTQFSDEAGEPMTREVVTGSREQLKDVVDLETLDALKRQLDVRIRDLEAKPSPDGDLIASLKANRQALVDDMDAASPQYRQARGYFEETARRQEAVGTGAKLGELGQTPDQIRATFDDLNAVEATEARNAAATRMSESLLDGKNINAALDPLRARGRDRRVRTMFGDEAGAELERRTGLERTMRDTERAGLGSNTANKLADRADIAGEDGLDIPALAQAARGNFFGAAASAATRAAQRGRDRYLLGIRGETAGQVGNLMLGGRAGSQQLEEVLRLLAAGREKEAGRLASRLRAAGTLGNVTGQQAGR